jgi:Microcystin-dependent protein
MAKITSLTELTEVADDDLLVVVDKSDTSMADSGTDKKVQKSNLIKDTVPAGVVDMFAGSTAPSGYLLCDGSAVSRSTYSKLFTAIGTTYGSGDGSTTFNLPNLKGKVAVGLNSADTSFDALGETGGEKAHTLTVAEMPDHNHGLGSYGDPSTGGTYYYKTTRVTNQFGSGSTGNTGGGGSHNNLQPYIVLNYIIKT